VYAEALELRRTIPPRTLARIAAFAFASLLLHALTLAIYLPEGSRTTRSDAAAQVPTIRAVLAPAPAPQALDELHAQPVRPEPPATAEPAASASEPARPLDPRKWYAASELDERAEPIGAVEIDYPEALQDKRIVGHVQLVLYIDESGVVRKAEVTDASPPGLFDAAAIKGWQSVRFTPAKKSGVAVKSVKLLEIEFIPEMRGAGGAVR
jgi:protein TonB